MSEVREKIIDITCRVAQNISELILYEILFSTYLITEEGYTSAPSKASWRASKEVEEIDTDQIREGLKYLLKKKLIKKTNNKKADFEITNSGFKYISQKLRTISPVHLKTAWDKKWLVILFDISDRSTRDNFRNDLKKLKFGQLQKSVWISPHNLNIKGQKIIEKYLINEELGILKATSIYNLSDKEIAKKAWDLKLINDQYKKIYQKTDKRMGPKTKFYQYLNVLKKDPELPKGLLPKKWYGEKLKKKLKKYFKLPQKILFDKK